MNIYKSMFYILLLSKNVKSYINRNIYTNTYTNTIQLYSKKVDFNKIELEFNTLVPPANNLAQTLSICDPATGNVIGVNKPTWDIYIYNYNLYVMEERINQVIFVSGNCGLLYAS